MGFSAFEYGVRCNQFCNGPFLRHVLGFPEDPGELAPELAEELKLLDIQLVRTR